MRALDPETGLERQSEREGVDDHVAARVVADQQHRTVLGDVLHAADVGAQVQAGEHPEKGQLVADVVGIALIEVGPGDAPADLQRG
ncbi:MAG: hypothetical protein JF887_01445 [Candidatus Dormibacteraeota bacterium]|uniref:Uncharacterized protein n=1 Tax=Candidatus Amunia macphersoniae TaxID=3127014 RepID=A0A934KHW5_9BACT|nr:hypothetical protein [Candidatus Dormibacteraeota bacterium]